MTKVRVNSKNQIVIPAEARRKLGIKPGDSVFIDAKHGALFLMREPDDYVESLRGLGKGVWADVDVDEWLRNERESWEES